MVSYLGQRDSRGGSMRRWHVATVNHGECHVSPSPPAFDFKSPFPAQVPRLVLIETASDDSRTTIFRMNGDAHEKGGKDPDSPGIEPGSLGSWAPHSRGKYYLEPSQIYFYQGSVSRGYSHGSRSSKRKHISSLQNNRVFGSSDLSLLEHHYPWWESLVTFIPSGTSVNSYTEGTQYKKLG